MWPHKHFATFFTIVSLLGLCSGCGFKHAVHTNNVELAKKKLDQGADPDEYLDDDTRCIGLDKKAIGKTALVEAAVEYDVEMVELLLKYGADPDRKSCEEFRTTTYARSSWSLGTPVWSAGSLSLYFGSYTPAEAVMLSTYGRERLRRRSGSDADPGWERAETVINTLLKYGADIKNDWHVTEPFVEGVQETEVTLRLLNTLLSNGAPVAKKEESSLEAFVGALAVGYVVAVLSRDDVGARVAQCLEEVVQDAVAESIAVETFSSTAQRAIVSATIKEVSTDDKSKTISARALSYVVMELIRKDHPDVANAISFLSFASCLTPKS